MRLFVLFSMFIAYYAHAQDDWFDTGSPSGNISVRYGVFEGGDELQSVLMNSSFILDSQISLQVNQFDSAGQDEDQWLLQIETDPLANTSFSASYAESERDQQYQFDNITLGLRHSISDWDFRLIFGKGDIELGVEGIPEVLEGILDELGVFDATQTQYGVGVSYFGKNWGVSFEYDQFDLDQSKGIDDIEFGDLNQAQRRALFALVRDFNENGTPRGLGTSLAFAGFSVDQQLSAGLDETIYTDAFYSFDNAWVLTVGVEIFKVIFTDDRNTALFSSVDIPVAQRFGIGLLLGADDISKSSYSELRLRYTW